MNELLLLRTSIIVFFKIYFTNLQIKKNYICLLEKLRKSKQGDLIS